MAYGERRHEVTVSLTSRNGRACVEATNAGAVGKHDWIGLYRGRVPPDPNTGYVDWQWVTRLPYVSNTEYSQDLVAAYVAWDFVDRRWEVLARHDQDDFYVARIGLDPTPARKVQITGGMHPQRGAVGAYDWVGIWADGEKDDLNAYLDWQWVRHLPYQANAYWGAGYRGLYVAWDYAQHKYVELARTDDMTRWR